jgi:hypothetical protein
MVITTRLLIAATGLAQAALLVSVHHTVSPLLSVEVEKVAPPVPALLLFIFH